MAEGQRVVPQPSEPAEPVSESAPALSEHDRAKAAGIIQRNYRGHKTRNAMKSFSLDPQTRWMEAVKDAQYQNLTTPNDETTKPPARRNWIKATKIAGRAGADDVSGSESDSGVDASDLSEQEKFEQNLSKEDRQKRREKKAAARAAHKENAKMMDLQYFLEMVDQKHRYGSNLRKYHSHWKQQDTKQSYFYWLDLGEGKDVTLSECSRERLNKEQVRYLSKEERTNYLVKVNSDGFLIWAKNGELVWTKDELYKDSINGIVPTSDPTPKFRYNVPPDGAEANSSSTSDNEDDDEVEDEDEEEEDVKAENEDTTAGDEGERYVNEDFHRAKGFSKIKYANSSAVYNHLMRESLRKGQKWIYVADTSFRLYIGYKQSGAFQHSSFLHGSRITSAGQIKVKRGQLRNLAPLSGHYRPPTENFRSFVQNLEDEGVDMSRVSISKSYAILIGLEKYTRTKKKVEGAQRTITHTKDKMLHPEKVKAEEEAKKDNSESAEKERQYLERQRHEREQNTGNRNDSPLGRLSRALGRPKGKKVSKEIPKPVPRAGTRVVGTGPEDGNPPPEGKR